MADRPTSPVPTVVFSAASTRSFVAARPAAAPAPAPMTPPAAGTPEGTSRVGVARGRPTHRRTRHSRTLDAVHVQSMNDPQPGWTVDRALGRLAQGYAVEQVSRLSGYAVPFLRSRLHRSRPAPSHLPISNRGVLT